MYIDDSKTYHSLDFIDNSKDYAAPQTSNKKHDEIAFPCQ